MKNHTFNACYVKTIVDTAESLGVSRAKLLTLSSLSEQELLFAKTRIDEHRVRLVLEYAVLLSGNPYFGIDVGRAVQPGTYSALGYTLMSSKSLEEAIELNCQYGQLVSDIGHVELIKNKNTASMVWHPGNSATALLRPLQEAIITGWWTFSQWIIGNKAKLTSVHFCHPKPHNVSVYEKVFDAPVYFSQKYAALSFDTHYLQKSLTQRDEDIHLLMLQKTKQMLNDLPQSLSYKDRVDLYISSSISQGPTTLEDAADKLSISIRSLRHHLKKESTSYQTILNDVRKRLSCKYLEESSLSIQKIAETLNYQEIGSFSSSFKKWTGVTPSEYRQQHIKRIKM